ncbi:hypothetical protein PINS_up019624 [Pythium insidiosum]|nr:hypothetical protein PINS_up019624 [Pythium insidiosum]
MASSSIRSATSVANYMLGRLLAEDLHVSCRPMLPTNVDSMNGTVLQGVCLLQIVDVVNIGANIEHRKDDTKGPTRTLKLCLTDGHQLVYGFELKWLPTLSVATPRGTKVIVQNVAVRHGLLLLTPETFLVLGASGNEALDVGKALVGPAQSECVASSGAYAAAVKSTKAPQTTRPRPSSASIPTPPPAHPQAPVMRPTVTTRPMSADAVLGHARPANESRPTAIASHDATRAAVNNGVHNRAASISPPVIIDVSGDERDDRDIECASDTTDPGVEHLFYSPNTPRNPSRQQMPTMSRKRPHPESGRAQLSNVKQEASTFQPPPLFSAAPSEEATGLTALSLIAPLASPPVDRSLPYRYLSVKNQDMCVPKSMPPCSTTTIRAFVKSVAGFQFNTGTYELRVLVEDGTQVREVRVCPSLVERLMGVSCGAFMTAMQRTPTVAHRWAAQMQVTLMTMQGLMSLQHDSESQVTLMDCRDYSTSEARALLARVRSQLGRGENEK